MNGDSVKRCCAILSICLSVSAKVDARVSENVGEPNFYANSGNVRVGVFASLFSCWEFCNKIRLSDLKPKELINPVSFC